MPSRCSILMYLLIHELPSEANQHNSPYLVPKNIFLFFDRLKRTIPIDRSFLSQR